VNDALVSQIVRSATSIGANYMEADGAESKKDFRHKISHIVTKEIDFNNDKCQKPNGK
jgi:four helix bundle protein